MDQMAIEVIEQAEQLLQNEEYSAGCPTACGGKL